MRRLLPVLVLVLTGSGLLAGCGDSTADDQAGRDTSASSSASPSDAPSDTASAAVSPTQTSSSAAALPACDSVWVDGQQLSLGYGGCLDGSRTVGARKQPCEFGKPLLTYRNTFWAVAGGPVHEVSGTLAKDAGWRRALVQCGG